MPRGALRIRNRRFKGYKRSTRRVSRSKRVGYRVVRKTRTAARAWATSRRGKPSSYPRGRRFRLRAYKRQRSFAKNVARIGGMKSIVLRTVNNIEGRTIAQSGAIYNNVWQFIPCLDIGTLQEGITSSFNESETITPTGDFINTDSTQIKRNSRCYVHKAKTEYRMVNSSNGKLDIVAYYVTPRRDMGTELNRSTMEAYISNQGMLTSTESTNYFDNTSVNIFNINEFTTNWKVYHVAKKTALPGASVSFKLETNKVFTYTTNREALVFKGRTKYIMLKINGQLCNQVDGALVGTGYAPVFFNYETTRHLEWFEEAVPLRPLPKLTTGIPFTVDPEIINAISGFKEGYTSTKDLLPAEEEDLDDISGKDLEEFDKMCK